MPVDRQSAISDQSLFYRNGFRKLLTFALFLLIVVYGLIGLIFYQYIMRPPVNYFVTTSDGRLIQVFPQN